MHYYTLWIIEMFLWIAAGVILASIITAIFDYAFKPDHLSLDVLIWIISFALFGASPIINIWNSSDVVLVSEKTHDVDKIITENGLKVHIYTFHPMRPVKEDLKVVETDITYIEPDVKYVMYWTTGLGEKKMRAFKYIKKESIIERQAKINQAEIDRYKLNPSVSGNN